MGVCKSKFIVMVEKDVEFFLELDKNSKFCTVKKGCSMFKKLIPSRIYMRIPEDTLYDMLFLALQT
jgi:hypothetical protein